MISLRRPVDHRQLELFGESGDNAHAAALLLADMLRAFPDRSSLAQELVHREHEGDRITHDIIHRLNGGGSARRRPPFDSADVYELARALDDIVDHTEETGDALGVHGVEAPMEQAVALAEILVEASEQVAVALRALDSEARLGPVLLEIHRLENEGDRLRREAVASLFATGIDPMVVIRWKDIFDSLEAAIDACETVAHILEGISLKRT